MRYVISMVNPGKVRKRILYIPRCMPPPRGDATAIHSHYRRALGSRAPSVAMLDDGGVDGGGGAHWASRRQNIE